MKRKFCAFFLVLLLLLSSLPLTGMAQEPMTGGGISFDFNSFYSVIRPYDELPITMEAKLQFPESMDSTLAGGVILGNYFIGILYLSLSLRSSRSIALSKMLFASKKRGTWCASLPR